MSNIKFLVIVVVFLFALPVVAYAQQVPPHIFIGKVFDVSGGGVAVGTAVTAYINGVAQGSTSVQADGTYSLMVTQGAGTNLTFKIGSLDATETATWQQGGATVMNLNSDSGITIRPAQISSAQGSSGDHKKKEGPPGPAGSESNTGAAESESAAQAVEPESNLAAADPKSAPEAVDPKSEPEIAVPQSGQGAVDTKGFAGTQMDLNPGSDVKIQPAQLANVLGSQGVAGPRGDAGAAGTKGDAGVTGPKGDPGAAGPAGGTLFSFIAMTLAALAASFSVATFLRRRNYLKPDNAYKELFQPLKSPPL